MLVNRGMGGGLNAPGFWLELKDSGAGAVSTTPNIASGVATATFTRATTAWTKLSTGLWASVGSGIARSTYLGLTTAIGAYAGYFAEGAATQLVTPTVSIRDMTDASWVKTTMTAAKTATGIDGVTNSASTITATAGNALIVQTLVAAASSRTYSCWIKRRTGTGEIDITQDGATFTNITAQINSSTFTLVQLNASQLNAVYGIRIVTNGDAVDVDFNQFEAGAFASSPLDTTGAVRNADLLNYPFAGNASASAGSLYLEKSVIWALNGTSTAVPFGFATANIGITYVANGVAATRASMFDGTTGFSKLGLADEFTGIRKHAASWGPAGQSVTGDGLAPATAAFDGDIGSTNISLGSDVAGANNWFGTIKNVRIWKTQLSDGQLASITG